MAERRDRSGVDEGVRTLVGGGVDRMVALPYVHKPGLARALNDFTLDVSRRHPEVLPCCTVFPGEEGAEDILEQALSGPFRGVKIHSHVMKIAPDDPRLDAVWRASARWRKPVVIHCGPEPALPGYGVDPRAVSGADRLQRALDRHPDAIAVVPHLGFDDTPRFEAMLPAYPNLWWAATSSGSPTWTSSAGIRTASSTGPIFPTFLMSGTGSCARCARCVCPRRTKRRSSPRTRSACSAREYLH